MQIEKQKLKKAEPGPTKGDALETQIIMGERILNKKQEQVQLFKKKRPKSAYHSKFARPSTGVHSLKNKRKM